MLGRRSATAWALVLQVAILTGSEESVLEGLQIRGDTAGAAGVAILTGSEESVLAPDVATYCRRVTRVAILTDSGGPVLEPPAWIANYRSTSCDPHRLEGVGADSFPVMRMPPRETLRSSPARRGRCWLQWLGGQRQFRTVFRSSAVSEGDRC